MAWILGLIIALVLIVGVGIGYISYDIGVYEGRAQMLHEIAYPEAPPEVIDAEQAIIYLAKARYSHQYYLDNPEQTSLSLKHHAGCVARYDSIISLLHKKGSIK